MTICLFCHRTNFLRAVQFREIYYLSRMFQNISAVSPSKRSNSRYFTPRRGLSLLSNLTFQTQSQVCKFDGTHTSSGGKLALNVKPTVRHFITTSIRLTDALSSSELKKSVDKLTDQFMEAREMLQDARESMGTVYFSDDMEEAQTAVKETLKQYQDLLARLSEEQRKDVLRTIGLKMEELKAQEQALKDILHDDH